MILLSFYAPWKHQETSAFLIFSECIETNQWQMVNRLCTVSCFAKIEFSCKSDRISRWPEIFHLLVLKSILHIYLSIYFFFVKVDLNLAYKKPINVNNNTAYISVNNNDDNKTEYLIVRQNQHIANIFYMAYMSNQAFTFLFFI